MSAHERKKERKRQRDRDTERNTSFSYISRFSSLLFLSLSRARAILTNFILRRSINSISSLRGDSNCNEHSRDIKSVFWKSPPTILLCAKRDATLHICESDIHPVTHSEFRRKTHRKIITFSAFILCFFFSCLLFFSFFALNRTMLIIPWKRHIAKFLSHPATSSQHRFSKLPQETTLRSYTKHIHIVGIT